MRTCVQGAFVAALCAAGVMAVLGESSDPVAIERDDTPALDGVTTDALTGLWSRHDRKVEGGPLRFWYFHGDGKGLYRYGRVGLNTTNSFDYDLVDGKLELTFRKTGERHALGVEIESDADGNAWLTIDGDPREPGARYHKQRAGMSPDAVVEASSEGPGGRMWIDYRNWATGGAGFHMYQFNTPAIDGRGIGWYHEGDFDDWSTESLTYRVDGDHLELFFDLREEPNMTHFRSGEDDEGRRWLELQEDPRNFWATRRLLDGGESFGGAEVWHWVTAH